MDLPLIIILLLVRTGGGTGTETGFSSFFSFSSCAFTQVNDIKNTAIRSNDFFIEKFVLSKMMNEQAKLIFLIVKQDGGLPGLNKKLKRSLNAFTFHGMTN